MPATIAPPDAEQGPIESFIEDFRRELATELSEWREEKGPEMAQKLEDVPPEERTAEDAVEAAVIGSTDFFDGLLTKGLPKSEKGREEDRRADRAFVLGQYSQLAENGEVPQLHYDLQVGREGAMKVVRWVGETYGLDLSSLQVNRFKTVANMGMLVTAQSPLATKQDLLRWESSVGTGSSLTGLFETTFQYLGEISKSNAKGKTSDPRNSKARDVSSGPVGFMAELIDQYAPGVQPSHITRLGELMVEGSSALIVKNPDRKFLSTALFTGGSLLDIVDGALARLKGVAGEKGMLDDIRADLRQQIAATAALSVVAMRRGNKVAAANYALATMAVPMSALTRAQAESKGLIVAEGSLGTRAGRGIITGIGMRYNDDRDLSDIVSATLAASTINTVYERQHVIRNGTDSEYCVGTTQDSKLVREANVRGKAILPYAMAGMAVGAALLIGNQTGIVEERFGLNPEAAADEAEAAHANLSDLVA